MDEFITACPRNCYSTCSFRVQVENNRIRRILPLAGNLATPEGPCIKGLSYIERSRSKDRLLYPLQKTAEGTWKELTTDEAHSIIAGRLASVREKYGSHSIFWYRGSGRSGLVSETGNVFWKYFGGVTTTYGNLCWPAGLEAIRLTLGKVMHNVPWDIRNARTIVIWGKNPAETNIHEMAFICQAREKGATVIVIDPRITPTSDKADIVFTPRPGTDAALALATAQVLVEESLTNAEFIDRNVTGFDQYRKKSLISPAEAETITGIPEIEIRRFAGIIGRCGPVTFLPGYGLQRYPNGGQTIRAILSLAVITGNLGRSGSGFNYANLQSYVFDDIAEPEVYYPDSKKDMPFRRTVSMAKLGEDMLSAKDPEIRAIWVERGNPLLQSPSTNKVLEAFKRSEFTVVVDQFMTDTAKKADIVLPAIDIFEQSDIIGSYWSPYVQFKPGILEPAGEIMPESDIYYRLARLLGIEVPGLLLPAPGNVNTESWLARRIEGRGGITLDNLRKGPVLPPLLEEIAYKSMKFETPSGKIELCSERFAELWGISPWPAYVPAGNNSQGEDFPLVFISPNTSARIHSQFGNLEVIRLNSEEPAAEISVADAAARNICPGDRIRLFNNNGHVITSARVSSRVREGTVVLHNGIWLEEGGGSNLLTASRETDIGFGAAFHGIGIEVEKLREP